MREYHGWKWQKFVCGCGSRRPNCGRTTVEEGDPDGPNFQWFLSNIDVRDPQHPAYRLSNNHYWIRLSILCTDDDGNTAEYLNAIKWSRFGNFAITKWSGSGWIE